jgi:hypothetical protein
MPAPDGARRIGSAAKESCNAEMVIRKLAVVLNSGDLTNGESVVRSALLFLRPDPVDSEKRNERAAYGQKRVSQR